MLTSALRSLFKDSQLRKYPLKKSNVPISDALNAQVSIKIYSLKFLKSVPRAFISISLKFSVCILYKILDIYKDHSLNNPKINFNK